VQRAILRAEELALVERERAFLSQLEDLLAILDAEEQARKAVRWALHDLSDLFLLVVVGEFNAGKSAVINALLEEPVLREGVTPTTSRIHIRYGEAHAEVDASTGVVVVTHPAPWLRNMAVVDTPGTNAVIRRHQEITEEFVPRSDLVLFITSADRPFTESERAFLERTRAWGKKVIFIVNKVDLLSDQGRDEVVRYVAQQARETLGLDPHVFAVSARLAQEAHRAEGENAARLWEASRFEALHTFIRDTLDQRERLRLKLSSPLGIASRTLKEAAALIAGRDELLQQDLATLDTVEAQLAEYEADMRREFTYYLSHVDNVLHEMAARGNRFFDETIRLTRLFDLLNSERLKREFERQVVAEVPQQVETQVSALIDWMVEQDFRQWQAITARLQERPDALTAQAAGETTSGFALNRKRLLDSVGREAQAVVASYDRDAEVRHLVQSVQTALAHTALVQAGAVGLGAILVTLLHGVLLDVTGMLGAGLMAAAGLYLLPARREKARRNLREKVDALRAQLNQVLGQAFERELERSLTRMRAALAPYSRFIRTEQARVTDARNRLNALEEDLRTLEDEVSRL